MLRESGHRLHALISRAPPLIAGAYLSVASFLCRRMLPVGVAQRVENSILSVTWSGLAFRPRRVIAGDRTPIWLTPHLGEFDGAALFKRRLAYEAPVFAWFEREGAARYQSIIEIGANVGVYSVFLDAVSRYPGSRLERIVAFEPSSEAYRRLLANLDRNQATRVTAFNAAIAETSGLRSFFEPAGHLTNGSLIAAFSGTFSDDVAEAAALTLAAEELRRFLSPATLIKIDVEGFEPELLAALSPLILQHHPDLLIEILPQTVARIAACGALSGYLQQLITGDGPQPPSALRADQAHRDWLLTWPGAR